MVVVHFDPSKPQKWGSLEALDGFDISSLRTIVADVDRETNLYACYDSDIGHDTPPGLDNDYTDTRSVLESRAREEYATSHFGETN